MIANVSSYLMAQGPWGSKKDDMGYLRDRSIGELMSRLGSILAI